MNTVDELEIHLQSLVEVHLVKYLPGYKPEDRLVHLLAVAMHGDSVTHGESVKAPNIYTIIAHPDTLTPWISKPRLLDELENALQEIGIGAGFNFSSRPKIKCEADTSRKSGDVCVVGSFSTEPLTETRGIPSANYSDEITSNPFPVNACLILGGTKIIPIDRSVVNIGRRLDNHIVIDDPRVSRAHAQIRTVNGRLVLFDLDSTGGTFVNEQRAEQTVLYPGDVISLAGVLLIFSQDLPSGRLLQERTEPTFSASIDRPAPEIKTDLDE